MPSSTNLSSKAQAWHNWSHPEPVRCKLLCIAHAGGNAAHFRHWPERLAMPELQVVAATLPGRARRLSEPPHTRISAVVYDLLESINLSGPLPYFLFGHSFGALVAFEMAREIRRRGLCLPQRIFASGRSAPSHKPVKGEMLHSLPQERFFMELTKRYGQLDAGLSDPELAQLLYPCIRGDIEAIETYSYQEEEPLETAIETFRGIEDHALLAESMVAWQQESEQPVRKHVLLGGHFFLHEHPASLAALLKRAIQSDLKLLQN